MLSTIQTLRAEAQIPQDQLLDLNINEIDSPVLSRLIEEVRNESESTVRNYDRAHNRHNR